MTTLDGERLKRIPGYPQYFISEYGRVINAKTKREQRLLRSNKQRAKLKVALSKDKKVKVFYVHRLVAEAFLEDYKPGYAIEHINKNHVDNWVGNLRMGRQLEKDAKDASQAATENRVSKQSDIQLSVPNMRPARVLPKKLGMPDGLRASLANPVRD